MLSKIINYITTDIWRIRLRDYPSVQSFLIRHLRIIILAIRGFLEDRCLLRASALTFYSLLSVGPVVALAFGIAKGFGMEKLLETQIVDRIPAQEEVLQQITQYAHALLANTQGGVIAGIGVVLLIWSVLKVLNHIEMSFNEIWHIKKSRSWKRKISNYLSFIVIAPILLMMYTSIPVFISTQITVIAAKITILQKISPLLFAILKLSPYVLIWGLFTVIYLLIPNTRVNFVSGLLGGIIAGTIFLLVQWAYINFQVGVAKYNPIYGSLAALPLLLIWLNLGWIILLIGAEYSFAHQNVETFEFEPDYSSISLHFKRLLTLRILHLLAKRFAASDPPLSATQISQILKIPSRHVRDTLSELIECGLVSNMQPDRYEESAFQPASDINLWTIKYVTNAMERSGVNHIPVAQTRELQKIEETLQKIDAVVESSSDNKLLRNI